MKRIITFAVMMLLEANLMLVCKAQREMGYNITEEVNKVDDTKVTGRVTNSTINNDTIDTIGVVDNKVPDDHNKQSQKPENITQASHNGVYQPKETPDSDFEGTIWRGALVFSGLSVLVILCLVIRSYRLRNGGSNSPGIVEKYGVRASRSDVEMRPLPLSQDDEDDTIFEVGYQTKR